VTQWERVLERILGGKADANTPFRDLCGVFERLGYVQDITGDHHIFRRPGQPELINLQPLPDGKAKAYQVRQVRKLLRKYGQTRI
jgi:hypothetical protein